MFIWKLMIYKQSSSIIDTKIICYLCTNSLNLSKKSLNYAKYSPISRVNFVVAIQLFLENWERVSISYMTVKNINNSALEPEHYVVIKGSAVLFG